MKSILIFGAGLNQLTLIKAAAELGLTTVVIDVMDNPPGKELADYFYQIGKLDYEGTKEIANRHKVSGIVTSQMENPLRLMARLADEMGFIFHSQEIMEQCLDKWLMKKALLQSDVPCAKGILFSEYDEITQEKISILSFPLVIKPKDGTSSQGVYIVESIEEILKYRPLTQSFSRGGEIILEEFLDGPEISVESITYKGRTTIIQYTEKFITPFPRTVELGHLQPAQLSESEKLDVDNLVIHAINALGIDNSASHSEVKLTKNGPKIVEVGARLGGDYISSYLVKNSCGVDMDRAAIQVALAEQPILKPTLNQFAYIKYLELPTGAKINFIEDWTEVINKPNVLFANLSISVGDVIEGITESKKRPGFVIVGGRTKNEVIQLADLYHEKMKKCITIEE